jgi:NADPH:quinone reductase-like Zn-dependent oxidoreductase
MRALVHQVYGSPQRVELAEKTPPAPGPGEVVVRVVASSLNTADLDKIHGRPRVIRLFTGVGRPRSPHVGLDLAGTVEQVGAGVTVDRPGDRVWGDVFDLRQGAFADYVCVPAGSLAPMPAGLDFEVAATVPHSGILAVQGLRAQGGVKPGDRVLIVGGGGCVGPIAIQIARSMGASEVTGVDETAKLGLMREAGADHVVDYTVEDPIGTGQKYDFILDIAQARSVLRYRRALTEGGRCVLIARTLGGFIGAALAGGVTSLAGGKRVGIFAWKANHRDDLDALGRLLVSGELEPIVDSRVSLEETPGALQRLDQGMTRGKVVVLLSPSG